MEEIQTNDIQVDGLTEKEAKEFKKLLSKFVKSYSQKKEGVSDEEWLAKQYKAEMPEITDEQARKMAKETIDAIVEYDKNLSSLNDECSKGKSKERWFVDKVSEASVGVSVVEYGNYLQGIDDALTNANAQMLRTVTTKTGEISRQLYLDGFIAEQHHVNSFNANATAENSTFFAEVKVPGEGETYGKNSFDIVIRDSNNPKAIPVHQYQVKYGKSAKHTIKLLKEHGSVTKYSNQQIVVPPEQVEEVRKAFPGKTIVSEIGGTDKVPIKSSSLTKDEAEKMQLAVQKKGSTPTVDWNSFTTKDLLVNVAKNTGMAGIQAAAITTGFSLAAKVLSDEPIETEEVVEAALKTGADAGIKAAAAGALKVSAEKGIISIIPKGTPAGIIANIACVGIENIKILSKVATGELTMSQGLERMGRTTTSMVYGIGWSGAGAAIGATALSWVPVVGPIAGGLLGGMVGYMAGSKFGSAVYNGLRAVGRGVKNVVKSAWSGIKSFGRSFKRALFG